MSPSLRFLVDASNCPVKAEIYRLAGRFGVPVVLVSANEIGAPFEPWLTKVVTGTEPVSGTIANEAGTPDIVITDDEALAQDLRQRGVTAFTTRGQRWMEDGPHPYLPPSTRSNSKSRFETVVEDELIARLRAK
jgi:uncharacterized protein